MLFFSNNSEVQISISIWITKTKKNALPTLHTKSTPNCSTTPPSNLEQFPGTSSKENPPPQRESNFLPVTTLPPPASSDRRVQKGNPKATLATNDGRKPRNERLKSRNMNLSQHFMCRYVRPAVDAFFALENRKELQTRGGGGIHRAYVPPPTFRRRKPNELELVGGWVALRT